MKLFNKIALTAVGAFMAIGGGVAAMTNNAKAAKAAPEGYTQVALADGTISTVDGNNQINWSLASGKITVAQKRGCSSSAETGQTTYSAVNNSYISAPRVYTGNYLEFTGSDGYMIVGVKISYNTTYYGNGLHGGSSIVSDAGAKFGSKSNIVTGAVKVVDDATAFPRTLSTSSGGFHEFTVADAAGVEKLYISNQNDGSKNTQLRITKLEINYIAGASIAEPNEIVVSGPDAVTFGNTGQFTSVAKKDGSSTNVNQDVVWSVSDATKASITSTGILTPIANGSVMVRATGKNTTTVYGEKAVAISGAKATDTAYVLDKTAPIASSGYDTDTKVYGVDGIALEITKAYTKQGTAVQFQKNTGKIVSLTAMPADIKAVTIQLNKESLKIKDFTVKVGASADALTALTGGVESYERFITFTVADAGMRYFEIDASTSGTFVADTIAFGLGNTIEATAVATAATANGMVNEQCAAQNVSSETWNTVAGVYATLDDGVKAILNGSVKTGYAEVEQLLSRYDYIVAKYGYSDFMGRNIASSRQTSTITNSSIALAMVVVSIASLSLVGAYFLLRKKRLENN